MNVPSVRAHPSPARCPGGGGGCGPRQEALGVDRACGNDFIGKACDIFSLLCVVLGGGWRCICWEPLGQRERSGRAHLELRRHGPAAPCAAPELSLGCAFFFPLFFLITPCVCSYFLLFGWFFWIFFFFFFSTLGAVGQWEASGKQGCGLPSVCTPLLLLAWPCFLLCVLPSHLQPSGAPSDNDPLGPLPPGWGKYRAPNLPVPCPAAFKMLRASARPSCVSECPIWGHSAPHALLCAGLFAHGSLHL